MTAWLNRVWYGQSIWQWILWPLSLFYRLIVSLRRWGFQSGFLKSTRMPVPVIIVGNITVGGTGKTPFCILLCEHLKTLGYKPGLVSRGYGGQSSSWPQTVTLTSDPSVVGDEPVLLVRRAGCPMVVGPDRVVAAKQLLADNTCDVIVSDDGLQHYALARDAEIVLIDHQRQLGNGCCLPAGPLRESQSRLKSVDLIIENGQDMQLVPCAFQAVLQNAPALDLHDLGEKRIVAMAGIGNPSRFFQTLTTMQLTFTEIEKPDHHHYTAAEFSHLDADIILMTEKDAVKCQQFADDRCYFLPVDGRLTALAQGRVNSILKGLGLDGGQ